MADSGTKGREALEEIIQNLQQPGTSVDVHALVNDGWLDEKELLAQAKGGDPRAALVMYKL